MEAKDDRLFAALCESGVRVLDVLMGWCSLGSIPNG